MKNLILFLASFSIVTTAFASNFILCESKYALCTTAVCTKLHNQKGMASCHCSVQVGYSVGQKPCLNPKKTNKGLLVHSRYYPIKSYVKCSNDRPWTWCLDSPCIVDKHNPKKAICYCSIVKNKGDYIIVANHYSKSACTKGLISSATVKGSEEITEFLNTQTKLKPFPIKVYKNK